MPSLQRSRVAMWRHREERRKLLTRGERIFLRFWMLAAGVAPVAGAGLLVYGSGATRTAGIVLAAIALLTMAVPVSPFLRARVRRREQQESSARP